MFKKDYSKSKIRNYFNKKLLKRHYLYKIVENRIYQIEYHHFYFVAYYDKPSIKNLIRCLKANHYIVWDCYNDFDIKNNHGSKCEVDTGTFRGFLNYKRRKEGERILEAKVRYWENDIINKKIVNEEKCPNPNGIKGICYQFDKFGDRAGCLGCELYTKEMFDKDDPLPGLTEKLKKIIGISK